MVHSDNIRINNSCEYLKSTNLNGRNKKKKLILKERVFDDPIFS